MGTHFDVEFDNGVKIKIYDTATSDAIGTNPKTTPMSIEKRRNQIGYEMDIEIPEGEGDQVIQSVLDAVRAYEIKDS